MPNYLAVPLDGKLEAVCRSGARRLRIPFQEYARHRLQGERWCRRCQTWHPAAEMLPSGGTCRVPVVRRPPRPCRPCACGCGTLTAPGKTYRRGHNARIGG